MASLSDSKAHFEARAKEYEVPDLVMDNLRVAGITTLAHLAFAFQRPGQDFDEQQFNDWALRVNQNIPPSMGAMAALRMRQKLSLLLRLRRPLSSRRTSVPLERCHMPREQPG